MGTFNTQKMLYGASALLPEIASRIQLDFQAEGYEVAVTSMSSGAYDISITKGGVFKAVIGMKTALKVNLQPRGGDICFEAGVGIFGQQVIPTVISMLFFWPVLITQIWGMVEQSKLDDKALSIAEKVIVENQGKTGSSSFTASSGQKQFCTICGKETDATAKFCPNCGHAFE